MKDILFRAIIIIPFLLTVILLAAVSLAHSGMNFTMLGSDQAMIEIPEFQSKHQAELWAYHVGYNEQIRRHLKSEIMAMRTLVASLNLYTRDMDTYRKSGDLMQKTEFMEIALRIIESNKDSAQLGSAFYIGMTPQ